MLALNVHSRELGGAMTQDETPPTAGESRFRATLIRVLVVQIVALTFLGILQVVFTP